MVSLDRLGRSLEDLIGIVGHLKRQHVGFVSLNEKLDTTTPGGMFIFHVFAALAEFIRTIIVANTNEGLAVGFGPWVPGEPVVRRVTARSSPRWLACIPGAD
ncbi:hypothetical protein GCM10017600_27310 [Streptosporangium carneum]|uniref:Resolvase/invertase-type recombinase catalytic domain-containing protein n=1 Tax=Streptosporangium carneum TaxID=47481 RepID=A0A9W6MCY0_9ACTN|nr:hypothetical protein GCM10017600_27310 [Streptosporangium carneum]